MTDAWLETLRQWLPAHGVELAPRLREREIGDIEADFGFAFPPDLRLLLQSFVPAGPDFPDWHRPHSQDIVEWLDMPADGITFDVEENDYWNPKWGERPDDVDDAVEEARRQVALAPILIPLHANHFLPARPVEAGNPVLKVMQSDVSVAAPDLGWFFHDELGAPEPPWPRPATRILAFWLDLHG